MSEIRVDNITDEAGTGAPGFSQGLPADALTGNVAADRITDALNATGSAPVYACRAWVNFDGKGTVSIRDSGNVSSITDNGTGDYRVNFVTAMPITNYSATISASKESSGSSRTADTDPAVREYNSGSCRIIGFDDRDNQFNDYAIVSLAIFC